MRLFLLIIVAFFLGCASSGPKVATGHAPALPFIEDDYPAALKLAQEKKLPLFVDTWAPWCHSCIALREHVLTLPELAKNEGRYVWLAINTEKPSSAAFLEKYPVENWPTLFIIDSATGRVALKWLGTATVAQLEGLFADGEKAVAEAAGESPEALLVQADGQYAQGKPQLAALTYGKAARKADASWERRPRTVESWLVALWGAKQYEDCARTGRAEIPSLPKGPSYLNACVVALYCASSAPDEAGWKSEALLALEELGKEALAFEGVLADDKSGLYESLVDAREHAKDAAGAKALGLQWLQFLEAEAAKAPNPAARAVFDAHRVNAAIAAGMPQRAEAALKQSAADFPEDYNPLARLALIYKEQGKLDEALVQIEKGLEKAYGPRKLRLFEIKAQVQEKKADKAGQKATLKKALDYGNALPAPQRPEKAMARIEAGLKAIP
jgi:thiol-disulfide isomerase/thioredoxin